MPVEITTLGLNRVRRGDAAPQLTVDGTGFSAANNSVFVSGSLATIVVQGTTQITFNLPAPFSLDLFDVRSIHVPILVVNDDTGETSTDAWTWIKADLDEAADERIANPIPGTFEITSLPELPNVFEARDMQRLAALVESMVSDVSPGNVLAWDGSKIAEPAGFKGINAGQILTVDLGEPTGLLWEFKLDAFLKFGRGTVATIARLAYACGTSIVPPGTPGTENWAIADGTLDLITFNGRQAGGGSIDRVRVLVNGVSQFDSGAISVTSFSQVISVAVLQGDRIELELTPNVVGSVSIVGGIRLLVD